MRSADSAYGTTIVDWAPRSPPAQHPSAASAQSAARSAPLDRAAAPPAPAASTSVSRSSASSSVGGSSSAGAGAVGVDVGVGNSSTDRAQLYESIRQIARQGAGASAPPPPAPAAGYAPSNRVPPRPDVARWSGAGAYAAAPPAAGVNIACV
jgi:hypothetical protein